MTRAMFVIAMLATLASGAHAEPPMAIAEEPRTGWSRLGTRIGFGSVPIDGAQMTTASIAVSLDRPLVGRWRVLGEYEHVWIGERDLEAHSLQGVASLANSGHRVQLGIRRRLLEKTWADRFVGVFLDGEAGGGAMLVDRSEGALAVPHSFVGIRAGFSLEQQTLWDYEVILRGLAVPDGVGVLFGIGLVWGQ